MTKKILNIMPIKGPTIVDLASSIVSNDNHLNEIDSGILIDRIIEISTYLDDCNKYITKVNNLEEIKKYLNLSPHTPDQDLIDNIPKLASVLLFSHPPGSDI